MITATGQQFKIGRQHIVFFQGDRMNTEKLFSVIRKNVVDTICPEEEEIYAHMDDTLLENQVRK
ncbi:MAG: hypothetical protein IPN72_10330 [Saprospiraceae bacterium]|nr:hypothetical protein [Saprospiraceae bacterium]